MFSSEKKAAGENARPPCSQRSEERVAVPQLKSPRQAQRVHPIGRIAVVRETARQPRRVLLVEDIEQIEAELVMTLHVDIGTHADIDDDVVAVFGSNAAKVLKDRTHVIERREHAEP